MYFLEDGTTKCGFYECKKCDYRFLSKVTKAKAACPLCEQDIDYETAELIDVIEGEEEVKRMDALLSVAYVDDESWL